MGYVTLKEPDAGGLPGMVRDSLDYAAFVLDQRGLPSATGGRTVPLLRPAFDETRNRDFLARQSYRHFVQEPLNIDALSDWLGALQVMPVDGAVLPKRRYGSAGGLYPVRLYLLVKAGAVTGLAGGAYVYDPAGHALNQVGDADFERQLFGDVNGAVADQAGLAIVFVGHLPAIAPLYGDWSRDACLIESGSMAQLLAEGGPDFGIGSCMIGGFDSETLRSGFALEDGDTDVILVAMLAGPIEPGQQATWSPITLPVSEVRRFDPAQALQALAGVLPGFMVPSVVVVLDGLPLSVNGKVDRAALPVPDVAGGGVSGSPVEVVVCALVGELLGAGVVGPSDDFFALGGHSLSAARLVARVRGVLGRVLEIRAVFEAPRLGDLAERVRVAPRVVDGLVPQERAGRLPLSFAQSRLWFLERLGEGGPAYHVALAAWLSGRLDAVALAAALDDVVGRHESLRTLLVEVDGEPWQQVLESGRVPWQRCECAPGAVDGVLADFAAPRFDLGVQLPLRALLVDVGADEHVLMLVVHHVAADGWSMGRLLDDLAVAYRARGRGRCRGGSRCRFSTSITRCGSGGCWAGRAIRTV